MVHHDGFTSAGAGRRADRRREDRLVIGWREYVDAPEWGVKGILAKIDTGARTSAIDVADVEEISGSRVRFHVVLSRNHRHRRVEIEAKVLRRTHVRSSLGHVETRIVVATPLQIGPVRQITELGLVCRKSMRCRMLLGRTAVDGGFLVDAGRTNMLGRKSRSAVRAKAKRAEVSKAKGRTT
jgi:hypothetical protein